MTTSPTETSRIGIFVPTGGAGAFNETVELIAGYEADGFGSVWFPQSTGPDPLVIAAAAGQHTRAITFGTGVIPVYPRHPAALAASARSAFDALGGRLKLGIGLSHKVAMEGRYRLDYQRPAHYMDEYVRILSPLLRGERADVDGELLGAHIKITDRAASGCSLHLAALQPRMLHIAGTRADGTITWCCGIVTVRDHIVPTIRQAAAGADRLLPEVTVILPVCVTGDVADGRAMANAALPGYEQLPVYRAVLDREGAEMPGDVSVVGDEVAVERQINAFFEAGATRFVALFCGDDTDRRRSRELLADLARRY